MKYHHLTEERPTVSHLPGVAMFSLGHPPQRWRPSGTQWKWAYLAVEQKINPCSCCQSNSDLFGRSSQSFYSLG